MLVRSITTVIMVALLVAVVYITPIQFSVIFMSIVTFLAVKELISISDNKIVKKLMPIVAFIGALTPITIYMEHFILLILVLSIVFIVCIYLKFHEELSFYDIFFMAAAITILPNAINALTCIFLMDYGKYLILIPMITAWGSDVFAYLVGRAIGKHKLAPHISPNKTIEGSIGGVLGGVVGMLIFGYFTQNIFYIAPFFLIIIGALGAFVGQIGDLFFSTIKRQAGIKDYSKLIPGHGGILDRFDSVIFTAPLALSFLTLI